MRAIRLVPLVLLCLATLAYADDRGTAEKKKQAGDAALASGRTKEALGLYQAAQDADPSFLPAFDAAAPLWFSAQDYKTAISRLELAVARRADYSMGWYNLAFAYRKTTDYRKAVLAYQRFTELRPGEPDPYYGLGVTYKAMGDAASARASFEKYVELEKRPDKQKFVQQAQAEVTSLVREVAAAPAPAPAAAGRASAVALVGEGDAKRYAGESAEAEAKYRAAAKADPSYGAAYRGLGALLVAQKKIDAAILELETAVAVDAKDDAAWYQLAHSRRKLGRPAEAALAYRKYIELKPENPDPYYGLGQALLQVGDKPGAKEALTKYIVMEQRPSEDQWVFKAKEQLTALEQEEKEAAKAAAAPVVAPAAPKVAAPAAPASLPSASAS
jgi:tetratricopeptide (TPR) repeat protein